MTLVIARLIRACSIHDIPNNHHENPVGRVNPGLTSMVGTEEGAIDVGCVGTLSLGDELHQLRVHLVETGHACVECIPVPTSDSLNG